jgi:hypothetical protein
MERGRFRWGRRAGHVPADRGADPRNPGHGSDPWPGEPRRRLAQRTHVRWPRLAGRCGLSVAVPPEPQGRCARRRTAPTSGPASRPAARAPRAISSRCPVGPGKRPREGRGGGDGGACAAHARPPPRGCGDGARVRLTRDHPHVVLCRIPQVVLRCSPQVVVRRGDGRPAGLRSFTMTFMRLLQTCRARSRLGRFASLSPTRTSGGSGPPGP